MCLLGRLQCFKGINLVQMDGDYQYNKIHIDEINDFSAIVINQLAGHSSRHYKIQNFGDRN